MSQGIESGQGYFSFNHSLLRVYLIPGIVKHSGCGNEQSRLQSFVAAVEKLQGAPFMLFYGSYILVDSEETHKQLR